MPTKLKKKKTNRNKQNKFKLEVKLKKKDDQVTYLLTGSIFEIWSFCFCFFLFCLFPSNYTLWICKHQAAYWFDKVQLIWNSTLKIWKKKSNNIHSRYWWSVIQLCHNNCIKSNSNIRFDLIFLDRAVLDRPIKTTANTVDQK